MEKIKLSFGASSSSPDLELVFRFNNKEIYRLSDISRDFQVISYEFESEESSQNCIEIGMQGKTWEHTKIDPDGNIIEDSVIEIKDIIIDDFNIDNIFFEKSLYHHDTNGTTPPCTNRFYGTMGCNGVVKFQFSTPFYLWLLENMYS